MIATTPAPSLDRETLTSLYRAMLLIRRAEERVAAIYPTDKIQSPIHLSLGQEAISAAVALALGRDDRLYGTYRGHGLYIARGGDLGAMFAELYGKETGCCRGKGGSMHMIAPEQGLIGCSAIVGSTIPVAAGAALAARMDGRKRVVAAMFGDGAIDEGVFYESLNFAALKNLPLLFVCENNNYAVHSRVSDRHLKTEIFRYGEALGVPGRRIDGEDVEAAFSAVRSHVDGIRAGGGPQLIECMTYRRHEHVGPGKDHKEKYREQDKLAQALERDPLEIAAKPLRARFRVPAADFARWEAEVKARVDDAVAFAEKSPFPSPERLLDDVFEEAAR
jgi:TPP-dependent pyruvate/acetoin dehydrogenase alpha subunit